MQNNKKILVAFGAVSAAVLAGYGVALYNCVDGNLPAFCNKETGQYDVMAVSSVALFVGLGIMWSCYLTKCGTPLIAARELEEVVSPPVEVDDISIHVASPTRERANSNSLFTSNDEDELRNDPRMKLI